MRHILEKFIVRCHRTKLGSDDAERFSYMYWNMDESERRQIPEIIATIRYNVDKFELKLHLAKLFSGWPQGKSYELVQFPDDFDELTNLLFGIVTEGLPYVETKGYPSFPAPMLCQHEYLSHDRKYVYKWQRDRDPVKITRTFRSYFRTKEDAVMAKLRHTG